MQHWLCVAICRPPDQSSELYPDIIPVAPDRSQIQLVERDGNNVRQFASPGAMTARFDGQKWINTQHFEPNKFDCLVTDTRIILSQARYKKKLKRPVLTPIWLAPFVPDTETSVDQSVLAGHVHYAWVASLSVHGPELVGERGWIASPGGLHITMVRPEHLGGSALRLIITLPAGIDHNAVAHDIARRIAAERLAADNQLSDYARESWSAFAGSPINETGADGTVWTRYSVPTYQHVGDTVRHSRINIKEGSL